MRVTGNRVLIEQVSVRKKVVIKTLKDDDEANFNISFEIKQIGANALEQAKLDKVGEGDFPILGQYTNMLATSVIHTDANKVYVMHHIINYDDIIGIDEKNPVLKWQK